MKNLSETEEKIYTYMKYYFKEKGYCPTLYEISNFIGKSYGTTKNYVDKLKEKDLVQSVHSKKRFRVWEYILL